MRRSLTAILMLVAAAGCSNQPGRTAEKAGTAGSTPVSQSGDWFVDRAAEAALDFVHFNGMSGAFYESQISQASPTGRTLVLIGMSVAAMESPVVGRSRDAERSVAAMFRNVLMRSRGSRGFRRATDATKRVLAVARDIGFRE